MTAMTAIATAPALGAAHPADRRHAGRPTRHLVSVPTGDAVHTRLRITRRGRLALTTLVAGAVLALGAGQALAGGGEAPATVTTTVAAGQTLGEIAAVELPGVPLDDAILAIQTANGLSTAHVHAGQVLVIPGR